MSIGLYIGLLLGKTVCVVGSVSISLYIGLLLGMCCRLCEHLCKIRSLLFEDHWLIESGVIISVIVLPVSNFYIVHLKFLWIALCLFTLLDVCLAVSTAGKNQSYKKIILNTLEFSPTVLITALCNYLILIVKLNHFIFILRLIFASKKKDAILLKQQKVFSLKYKREIYSFFNSNLVSYREHFKTMEWFQLCSLLFPIEQIDLYGIVTEKESIEIWQLL